MATINIADNAIAAEIGYVTLRIDLRTGSIAALEYRGRPALNVGCETGPGFAFRVDGFRAQPAFVGHECEEIEGGATIRLSYEFSDGSPNEPPGRKYLATQILTVTRNPDTIERVLRIKRLPTGDLTGPGLDKLRSATLKLCGAALGSIDATRVSCPMLRVVPGTPLAEMRARPRFFPSGTKPLHGQYDTVMRAPDGAPGCAALEGAGGDHVSITPLPAKCAALLRVFGERDGVTIEHEFACSSWMDIADEIEAARQVIIFQHAAWRGALPAAGKLMADHFPPKTDLPAWADNAIVYESEPTFDGGFAGIRGKLDAIKKLGANAVYVMPWHVGAYCTREYYTPDPKLGTIDDLKATVAAAHDVGLKVLFDLLTNIAHPDSPLVKEHPEFFYRDQGGRVRSHSSWASRCLDPASPQLRRYLADYASWCVAELGADGFRVDADAHRGANWNCLPGLQPHEHSHAVFTLLDEIRDSIRSINPDAIMMPECFGPIQASIGDMVCYQWLFWVDWAMELLSDGRLTGAGFQRLIAEQIMTMPTGTKFAYYSHTHDSLAFLKRDVRGPVARAYFASLAFLGAGVMYFGGGWGMGARPEPDEVDEYRRMFALRNACNGFAGYATEFPEPPDADVFIYRKVAGAHSYAFLTNFSNEAMHVEQPGEEVFSRTGKSGGAGGSIVIAPYDTLVVETQT
ncbi:MAG: hypothetical protein HQ592_11035 [Planctomycetes bacterium]|nr:hypothetical protein [Planctomycetota bacterium]